ncbi:MAG: chemotaxis protein CheD [Polyangiales bacterium]
MSAPLQSGSRNRITLGLAEFETSRSPDVTFITYALGSCLGITLYDPVARVGGLLHVMLPSASVDPAKAKTRPGMFVDTGLPHLFHSAYKLGAVKSRLIVKVAGGATRLQSETQRIAARNIAAARKILWQNSVLITAADTGGKNPRTMSLRLSDGEVMIKTHQRSYQL